jgi:hypothetical protein
MKTAASLLRIAAVSNAIMYNSSAKKIADSGSFSRHNCHFIFLKKYA